MSQGSFQIVNYGSNKLSTVHPIRIQPETLTLTIGGVTNSAPIGSGVLPSAQVSQGKRKKGLNARTVTFKFAPGSQPTGYKPESPITLPWLQNNDTFNETFAGQTGTYQGSDIVVVGTANETAR
jgi:hypothetical protein